MPDWHLAVEVVAVLGGAFWIVGGINAGVASLKAEVHALDNRVARIESRLMAAPEET